MITDISVPGLNFIRAQEGRALRAYQDSVGVWTLGYGLTNYDKGLPWKIGKGVTCTVDQAEWFLYKSLRENYLPDVERVIDQAKVPHAQGAIDSGSSFHYNTGGIKKATWPAKLNAGQLEAARVSLESWNKAGGNVLTGLVRRRAAEWKIIASEDYGQLTGPEIEDDRGRGIGHAELLTAYPTPPDSTAVGTVATTGVPVPTTPAPGVLTEGSTGPAVSELQDNLSKVGHPVPTTGTFDAVTAAAVKAFQQTHPNLTADSKVGPATSSAIVRAMAMKQQSAKVAKVASAAPAAAAALWPTISAHSGELALAVGITFAVVALAFIAWQYRHELHAAINKKLGRAVD